MINIRQIEAFNAVMSTGTTTRAAELLQISQPAVSRLVNQLEHSTKLKLFERQNGRLSPTYEATLYFQEVRRSLGVLERLKLAAGDIREYGSGNLKIAALPALGFSVMPRTVSRFLADHKEKVSIKMEVSESRLIRELVSQDQFDIGFVAEEIETAGILHELFTEMEAVCVMPADHELARNHEVRVEDLANVPFISLSATDNARRRLEALCISRNVKLRIVAETHYALSIAQFASNGIGVGLINPISLGSIPYGNIAVRPFFPKILFRTFILFSPEKSRSKLSLDFANVAREQMKQLRSELVEKYKL